MSDEDDEWEKMAADAAKKGSMPVAGVNKETLRAALRLNPALRKNLDTEAAIDALAKAPRAQDPEPQHGAQPLSKDVSEALPKIHEEHDAAEKRIAAEIQKLKKELDELPGKSRQRVFAVLLNADPGLTGPMTAAMLKREKAFLDKVGFSVDWFIDQKTKKR